MAGCARNSPKTFLYLYISILLYFISACLNENVMRKKLDIYAEPGFKVAYLRNIWSWRQRQSRCQTEKSFQCKKSLKKGQTYVLCSPKGLI